MSGTDQDIDTKHLQPSIQQLPLLRGVRTGRMAPLACLAISGGTPLDPPERPPQTPTVTEVVYTTNVVYIPLLINSGPHFDILRFPIPVKEDHCD